MEGKLLRKKLQGKPMMRDSAIDTLMSLFNPSKEESSQSITTDTERSVINIVDYKALEERLARAEIEGETILAHLTDIEAMMDKKVESQYMKHVG